MITQPSDLEPWGLVALLGQAIMLGSILGVTGIPPTENQALRSKGQAYRAYQARVSRFIPLPPPHVSDSGAEAAGEEHRVTQGGLLAELPPSLLGHLLREAAGDADGPTVASSAFGVLALSVRRRRRRGASHGPFSSRNRLIAVHSP